MFNLKINNTTMKKTYIIPAVSIYKMNVADGILLSASGGGDSLLGGGGGTSGNSITNADIKGYNDWDIWGTGDEDYDDDY